MDTLKKILLKILGPIILSKSRVVKIEDISDKLRILTIKGKSLKKANWIAGQKVTFKLSDKEIRSYTPMNWNKEEGSFQTVIYLHNKGPLSRWAGQVKLNSKMTIMGPRASLAIDDELESFSFFGDETTFGLAHALQNAHPNKNTLYILESSDLDESKKALNNLNLNSAHLIKSESIEAVSDLIWQHYNQFSTSSKVILSGKQQTMVKIRHNLLERGILNQEIIMKVYWGWKDDPNGKLKLN